MADRDERPSPGLAALEGEETPTFDAPWQARAFAIAVALSADGAYEWDAFQDRLAAEIEQADDSAVPADRTASEADYYRRWLAALERLLVSDGVLESGTLTERTREFAVGDRDASEWVEGEHDHDHGAAGSDAHDHGHDHSR
ncbi:nitrile hydratase accessory protein [Natronorubrum texcoconense]|uniref:Nitrile hydratase accessory protein n=1 Tax=Natronorubrum texcoconense TaxID=1095776 RepID=A0A1G9EDM7_9EURY|nr:nitrile hydratase accessory protein [Natronorubrum texcoconense]SDK74214.1 nitrile hydratase accessory protein [Natronorubrum texcoconense]